MAQRAVGSTGVASTLRFNYYKNNHQSLGGEGGYFFVPKNVTKSVINDIIKDKISYVLIAPPPLGSGNHTPQTGCPIKL